MSTRATASNSATVREPVRRGEPLLTPQEAAAYLSIKEHTLANWRALGDPVRQIPFVKVGRLVRYKQSALDDYLNRCERP